MCHVSCLLRRKAGARKVGRCLIQNSVVSEVPSLPPGLDRRSRSRLQHLRHGSLGLGVAPKTHIGDGQLQRSVGKFRGLEYLDGFFVLPRTM